MEAKYLTAVEAAATLGVSVPTFYVYVSRKRIPSHPVRGSRHRLYWKADIDRLKDGAGATPGAAPLDLHNDSEITFLTPERLFYRGHDAVELAGHASLEQVAALLWETPMEGVFTADLPSFPPLYDALQALLQQEDEVTRATAAFPILEAANPKAFDMSPRGMARTGVDVVRTLAAISLRAPRPTAQPIHEFVAVRLGLDGTQADLLRRLLVLSADHGLEPGAFAVRATASAGVSPWRCVMAGLSVTLAQRSRFTGQAAMSDFLEEVLTAEDPVAATALRLRSGAAPPGFESGFYADGDPRARAILAAYAQAYPDDPALAALELVARTVREARGEDIRFTLAWLFVGRRLRLPPDNALLHVARAVGWVAHAIEQFHIGERTVPAGR